MSTTAVLVDDMSGALAASPIPTMLVTPGGRCQWVNDAACAFFGLPREGLLGRSWQDLTPSADAERDGILRRHLLEGRLARIQRRKQYRHSDGSRIWADLTVACLREHDGAPRFLIAQLVDVTDTVTLTAQLEESRSRLRMVIDADLDPRAILEPKRDDTGKLVDFTVSLANPAAFGQFGRGPNEVIGHPMSDLVPADAFTVALELFGRVLDGGGPLVRDRVPLPTSISGPGRTFDVRVVRVDGCLSVTWRDVTSIVDGERRLEESELRYRLLAEYGSDVVLLIAYDDVLHPEGRIEWVSPAARTMLLVEPQDLTGRTMAELIHLVHTDRTAHAMAAMERALEVGEAIRLTLPIRRGDGAYRLMEAAGSPVPSTGPGPKLRVVRLRDVDAQEHALQQLEVSEEQFRLLAQNSTDVVLQTQNSILTWISPALIPALGWRPEEWVGHSLEDFTHQEDVARLQMRRADIGQGQTSLFRIRMADRDGAFHWVEVHGGPNRDADGHNIGIVASFRVIDEQVDLERQREHLARFDALTGLMNRIEVIGAVRQVVAQTPRTGSQIALLFCDVDRFKDINDAHGHAAGDAVLRQLGERIRECIRSDDFAARIGGDEFLVVLTGLHDADEATGIAEKIRGAAVAPIEVGASSTIATSLSIGVALAEPDETVDRFIERADTAMYRAKKNGRNRVAT